MARAFDERGLFGNEAQGLCCNYVAWEDGTYSCDLMLGVQTEPAENDDFAATYTFLSGYNKKEEAGLAEWDKDFGPETNSVQAILNIVSIMDALQDVGGIIIGLFYWPLLIISIPMFLGDLYALWLVSMDKPFLFFDSPFLEKYFLWQIMSLDIVYDFVFFALWLILSGGDDNEIFLFFAVCSGIIFGFDLYQVYMFFYRYKQDGVEFDGRDLEQEQDAMSRSY